MGDPLHLRQVVSGRIPVGNSTPSRSKVTGGLLFRSKAPSIRCLAKKISGGHAGQWPLEQLDAEGGSNLPLAKTNEPADRIFTCSQAAKRLGISLSTLRRLVRDGTLWPTPMKNGEVGLAESEVQRFIDRFEKPAPKGE